MPLLETPRGSHAFRAHVAKSEGRGEEALAHFDEVGVIIGVESVLRGTLL